MMDRCLVVLSFLVTVHAHLVCWRALLRCHRERECELAYDQYVTACDDVIRGTRRQCPSHCVSAIIRLNQTDGGPELDACDCARDAECTRAKRVIEPCLPRTRPAGDDGIGCTEARQRCEEEPGCRAALTAYLSRCGQLFNGRKCSSRCRATIEDMLAMPDGKLLNRCVCDGLERPFCEVVKRNMMTLCSVGDRGASLENDAMDDVYEDEDYDVREVTDSHAVTSGAGGVFLHVVSLHWVFTVTLIL